MGLRRWKIKIQGGGNTAAPEASTSGRQTIHDSKSEAPIYLTPKSNERQIKKRKATSSRGEQKRKPQQAGR
jgi:hypothetical protein